MQRCVTSNSQHLIPPQATVPLDYAKVMGVLVSVIVGVLFVVGPKLI